MSETTKSKVNEIKRVVAEKYGVTAEQIDSRAKPKTLSFARHVAMWLCRKVIQTPHPYREGLYPMQYQDIAMLFKRNDHNSVMFAYQKIESARDKDPQFRVRTNDLMLKFGVIEMTGNEQPNDAIYVVRESGESVA